MAVAFAATADDGPIERASVVGNLGRILRYVTGEFLVCELFPVRAGSGDGLYIR
jgi:hypothetical protein